MCKLVLVFFYKKEIKGKVQYLEKVRIKKRCEYGLKKILNK